MGRRRKTTREKTPPNWKADLKPGPLLVVDQGPFLKKALTRCKQSITKVKKCAREIECFETQDKPLYEKEKAHHLGALLTEHREMISEFHTKKHFYEGLMFAIHTKGIPAEDAYDYVENKIKDPDYQHPEYDFVEDEEEFDEEDFDDDDFDDIFRFDDDDEDDDDEDEIDEAFRKFFEEFAHQAGIKNQFPPKNNKGDRSELKRVFRQLARRLHPDQNPQQTPLQEERWHEANQAYEEGDLETLEKLLELSEVEEIPINKELGLARLESITTHHNRYFKELSQRRRELKREPGWGFSTLSKAKQAAVLARQKSELKKVNRLMAKDLSEVNHVLEEFRLLRDEMQTQRSKRQQRTKSRRQNAHQNGTSEPQIDDWTDLFNQPQGAPKPKKQTPQKENPAQMEFSF